MLPSFMTKQIGRAQERYIARLCADQAFARREASISRNVNLSNAINPKEGTKVLELGCGPGKFVAMLAQLGFEVTGVDLYSFPTWESLKKAGKVTLVADVRAERLPFADASFDHIVCFGALLYFDKPQEALVEMCRVLRPNGTLLLRSVNRKNLYTRRTGQRLDPASHNLYDIEELTNLVAGYNFKVEKVWSYGFWAPIWPNLWWYFESVWLTSGMLSWLSRCLNPAYRTNNIVLARRAT